MKNKLKVLLTVFVILVSLFVITSCDNADSDSDSTTTTQTQAQHEHEYSKTWKHDSENHWHECSCGEKADSEAHAFGAWEQIKEATPEEVGIKRRTCKCGYYEEEDIVFVPTKHTITFKDENGNVLETKDWNDNSIPSYSYKKNDTAEWKYIFKGWSLTKGGAVLSDMPAVTENATYYAVVESKKQKYNVSFLDENGVKITDLQFEYGTTPSYNYTKSNTAEWSYTFKGWSLTKGGAVLSDMPAVTEDATYYAVIEAKKQKYNVSFLDENGVKITDLQFEYGTTPSYNYTKSNTAEWSYTFKGWSLTKGGAVLSDMPAVTENATYYAVVESKKQKYNVSFLDENGVKITDLQFEYGTTPSYNYTKSNTAEWSYTFKGWSLTKGGAVLSDMPTVTENATYYAVIEAKKNRYTLTFVTNGGTDIASITKEYGTTIEIPKTTKDGYSFVCWCDDAELNNRIESPFVITGNKTLYAKWNKKIDMVSYLKTMLEGFNHSPLEYLPPKMRVGAQIIDLEALKRDYTADFINVSDMPVGGFGEQWNMIIGNIAQSQLFFNALNVVEGTATTSIAAFQNYIDSNPSETANYEFKNGIYNVTIDFDGTYITYVLDYTATFPVIGEQTAQISLRMNITNGEKEVRVQLGEPNAIKYVIAENTYTFAIKYLGVRRAQLKLTKDSDGNVTGNINEHLTVKGVGMHSSADFYIEGDYVTVVGNKASGIPGFSGYICEVYDKQSGELLGYEVREEKTVLKISVVFNTLWFRLSDISGINSIKYRAATDSEEEAFFLNGSDSVFADMTVVKNATEISLIKNKKAMSRRYDIEMRKQYFYVYNTETEQYEEVEVKIPMLFIQEEQYGTFSEDIVEMNPYLGTVTVNTDNNHLEKIKNDYNTLVDKFIENKNNVTEEAIIAYIGDKTVFDKSEQ